MVGGKLCFADPAGPGQDLTQHRSPVPRDRMVQSVDGLTVLETVRLPGDHPYASRPAERLPRCDLVRH